jgi:hypothetical protein
MCRFKGIRMDQASECIECDIYSKGSITEGQESRIESSSSPKIADVVFVVDEGKDFFQESNIVSLAQKIKTELGKKNLRNIKFGLMGFNGQGVHSRPHYHTGGSSILFDQSELQSAVNNLQFKVESFTVEKKRDPMEALNKLAKYFPFRSASEKIAVLVANSEDCKGGKVGYYDLQSELLNAGITFHLVTSKELELEEEDGSSVIGFDAANMFPSGSRSAVRQPHDHCTALAQETNGAVFPFSSRKASQIVNTLSKKVGEKMTGPKCQVCECQLSCRYSNTPRTFCYPCDIPRPVSLTSRGSSVFNTWYKSLGPKKSQYLF